MKNVGKYYLGAKVTHDKTLRYKLYRGTFLQYSIGAQSVLSGLNKLLKEFSSERPQGLSQQMVQAMGRGSEIILATAPHPTNSTELGEILGFARLQITNGLTSCGGEIHDVVVLHKLKRQGIGEVMIRALIKQGRELKCDYLELTSNHTREGAGELYEKLGFEIYKTRNYVLDLKAR
jgi:ribosomal protein S18 acetylase RimI-like enzyme